VPTLPTLSLPGDAVNIQNVYANGLWDPTQATPQTLEILNGGLDADNQGAAANFVPTWAIQPGALVSGVYLPFERWEFIYGPQMAGNTSSGGEPADLAVPIAGLCARVFKPWDANVLVFGYQAFFQHDARGVVANEGDSPTEDQLEFWRIFFSVGGSRIGALSAQLPYGANQPETEDDPDNKFEDVVDTSATYMNENRWRYVSKTHAFKRGVAADSIMDKGYLDLKVSAWASLLSNDQWKCKCKVPSGALWIMAFR
jgi:hypothetical protein